MGAIILKIAYFELHSSNPDMKLVIFLVGILCSINLGAQDITISGRVHEGDTGNPLEFSTVTISELASQSLISGAVCDEDGRFEIIGSFQGEYTVSVSFVGFEEHKEHLLVGELNQVFDLGNIRLYPLSETLEEASVSAQKSTISSEMDRKTYSAEDMVAQAGGSVLDAMKTMPGVTVDQEGKVILRGSDKVVVLIDGKQSSLTGFGNQKGLDNIPVANIEKIEIINNPSAKYDARGMAGIINIIYKKEKEEGFNGDLGSYSVNSKYISAPGNGHKISKKGLNNAD